MIPLNDVALIEIEKNQFNIGGLELVSGEGKISVGHGILIKIPDFVPYLGFHAFAFDTSLGNMDLYENVLEEYKKLVGKRVYWSALSERGMVFSKDDKTYALIKLTDLVGFSEADEVYDPEKTELKY